ncbi:phospholipase D family protein [Thermomonas sp.]|uniref:phospholipase D family protein n=1 Tax=Thermomonas sp. TaxID=1971895 RepID=UPI001AC1654C|nr:phospholipase D family protein [Xanthomonadales bacterium]MBN8769250.1 phospholipase D family protein [Stenotrophomonas sp.]
MRRTWGGRWLAAWLVLLLCSGCATLGRAQRDAAAGIAQAARSTQVDCARADACATPSPVLDMAREVWAASTAQAPHHRALILDHAPDALLLRIHLIRSARRSIELQTYIFDEDDSAQLVMDELEAAAFRGVKVRILIDQLAALRKVETLAALASRHANLELRLYNPVLDRARLPLPMYAIASLCCWRQLNRRMHNKLLVVDGLVGIVGGRNYQDDYYDWGEDYNFRDRDLLLAGPQVAAMQANFEAFWRSPRSVPPERLGDVARYLRRYGAPATPPHHPFRRPERVRALLAQANDPALLRARFVTPALEVGGVSFIADLPRKHREETSAGVPAEQAVGAASRGLLELLQGAQHEVLLQTPYLVMSKPAQQVFRALHQRAQPPRVQISTNSLAATDAFIAYAMSYKYKRRYLRDFGFEIHEFKPFPADAPLELGETGAALEREPEAEPDEAMEVERADGPSVASDRDGKGDDEDAADGQAPQGQDVPAAPGSGGSLLERRLARRGLRSEPVSEAGRLSPFASSGGLPVRLKRAGLRMGLHAKSLVVDARVGVVGTHNFDPRGDTLNTESAVVIADPAFARQLAASILRDMAPANAWTIGRRDDALLLPGVEYTLAKLSERMPIFDLWPRKYATSFDYVPGPGCPPTQVPPSPFAADFRRCNQPVGDFPEVDLGLKWLGVRLFTAFGSGLSPIL